MTETAPAYGLRSLALINSVCFARRKKRGSAAVFGADWTRYVSKMPAFIPRWDDGQNQAFFGN